jgi:hypothetical protein
MNDCGISGLDVVFWQSQLVGGGFRGDVLSFLSGDDVPNAVSLDHPAHQ